ncbi:MAG: hypothetical protein QOE88_2164 [Verrucomicrobiota bacterium]|nr:hypothetical protein [Verrucomicrobiota bacterium]
MYRLFVLVCALAVWTATAESKTFDFQRDTFGFANQTYFDYKPLTDTQTQIIRRRGRVPDFSRHCFQLCRAVLQFFKFAEFRPDLPKVSESEYQEIVRRVSGIPAWSSGPRSKVIVPGYQDLNSFSLGETLTVQKNLGLWWPSYWRIGNWRIVNPVPRSGQEQMAKWLRTALDAQQIRDVYITRFKPINHCLVVYHYDSRPNGDLVFDVYDANQPGKLVHLSYHASDRSFYYDKTWYYRGGLVNVLPLYVSLLF